ncbi:hypothetical protein WA026_007345 [Henosepilachna vigintioctopunctata]|uniref:Kynurenine 3-monooxygenase n=1 Tax=Henosepilachna vigintioctopunctata TaxID=420089 RepID=A0AAW1UY45_9CUCU
MKVGSLCACFLAKRGYQIQVYEAREDLRKAKHQRGKSINLALSHRGRFALRSVGLEEKVLENAVPMEGRLLHSISNATKSIAYDKHTNQCIYSVSRNILNEILLTAAEKYPNVKLFFQCKLKDVFLKEGKCVIYDSKTKEILNIEADLIIGADGAFSRVRRCLQQTPLFHLNQSYIEHGYLELSVPSERGHLLVPNLLHIWPRGEFMMIALPNSDGSWTVTLFMSLEKFKEIDSKKKLKIFFEQHFPDAIDIIGKEALEREFLSSSPNYFISLKCNPYHFQDRALIIGDAAHAMVPFYGQGMNCGFEDCTVLDQLLEVHGKCSFDIVLEKFTQRRREDVHAICDLAMYNYIEMRDLVTRPTFHARKIIDDFLYKLLPTIWLPLYNSVSFTNTRYSVCMRNRQWQNKVLSIGLCILTVILFVSIFCLM